MLFWANSDESADQTCQPKIKLKRRQPLAAIRNHLCDLKQRKLIKGIKYSWHWCNPSRFFWASGNVCVSTWNKKPLGWKPSRQVQRTEPSQRVDPGATVIRGGGGIRAEQRVDQPDRGMWGWGGSERPFFRLEIEMDHRREWNTEQGSGRNLNTKVILTTGPCTLTRVYTVLLDCDIIPYSWSRLSQLRESVTGAK